ncbi:hypothetical protein [uncultured Ilyobacter sp.]|uniref:hypothetical protein n=1 Tax=uncultured Ilyobacter sp. TaxID=544433 RepID=UPI0029F5676A|nr:hypothetical protein [uncultured Ilyobacter sp.]
MKKVILGMMLVVGSLSFANDIEGRGDGSFVNNLYKYNQEKSLDENLSRSVKKVVNKDLSKQLLIEKERSSDRD